MYGRFQAVVAVEITAMTMTFTPALLEQARRNAKRLERLQKAERYHAEVKARTDMLFYVNKLDHWFDDGPIPGPELFARYGWRSVSAVVASSVTLVFYASAGAPKFLQDNCGKVRKRHERLVIDA